MQAEECSHGGLKCNYFCRTCHVGGTQDYKKSDQGYLELFKVSRIVIYVCTTLIFAVFCLGRPVGFARHKKPKRPSSLRLKRRRRLRDNSRCLWLIRESEMQA